MRLRSFCLKSGISPADITKVLKIVMKAKKALAWFQKIHADKKSDGEVTLIKFYIFTIFSLSLCIGCNRNSLVSGGGTTEDKVTTKKAAPSKKTTGSTDMTAATEANSTTPVEAGGDTDGDIVSEPVSVGGAYLTCISSAPTTGGSSYDLYCGLKKTNDHTLVPLAQDASVTKATLLGAFQPSVQLFAEKSPDPAWHWFFSHLTAKLADYRLLAVELTSSNIAQGNIRSYFADPRLIFSVEPATPAVIGNTDLSGSAAPISYLPWYQGEPNNKDNSQEDCGCLYDYAWADTTVAPQFGWNDYTCERGDASFACQSLTDPLSWVLSSAHGNWAESAGKCPANYQFSIPKNAAENAALMSVVNTVYATHNGTQNIVWIKMKRFSPSAAYFIIP